ncbi:MAG: biotin-dependent carboxyltransferase family protein [Qingshengfaniella sp.]
MTALRVLSAGPGVTVQDAGFRGTLGLGLSAGGVADPLAMAEGAALLGQGPGAAMVELAGSGAVFEAGDGPVWLAVTGAEMQASLGDKRLPGGASGRLEPGQRLTLGAPRDGGYGYLHLAGGVAAPVRLGSRSTHLQGGMGRALKAGDRLLLLPHRGPERALLIDPLPRLGGGMLRVIVGPQTGLFPVELRDRFAATRFRRDARANRQGMRLAHDGPGFAPPGGLSVLSDAVGPGDVQIGGDGVPVILLAECQTTGGYPRIGTVIPADLPRAAQAMAGAPLQFRFVGTQEALAAERDMRAQIAALSGRLRPLLRDPREISDLLSYQLVGGVTDGADDAQEWQW